jgi:ribosome biogenesis protein SSF1/2
MAGPLGVTHLMLFSKSSTGNTNMRLAVTPRGPTLYFKVEQYSLTKDVERVNSLSPERRGRNTKFVRFYSLRSAHGTVDKTTRHRRCW